MLLSAEDFLALSTCWERLELIDGRITPRPPHGLYASVVTSKLAFELARCVGADESAYVLPGAGFVLSRKPDTVLCPSIGVAHRWRYPNGELPDGFAEFASDLSCDTLYPEDRLPILEWRADRFLRAGALMHWVVNPFAHTVTVYSQSVPPQTLRSGDVLSAKPILSGFARAIDGIFDPYPRR